MAWLMDLFVVVGPNLLPLGHGRSTVWTGQQSASHSLRFAHSLSFLLLLSVAKASPASALKPQCLNQSRKGRKCGDEIIPKFDGFLPHPVIGALFLGGGLGPVLTLPFPFSSSRKFEQKRGGEQGLQQMHLQSGLLWNCISLPSLLTTRFPKLLRNLSSHSNSWEVIKVGISEEEMGINLCRGSAPR